MQKDNFIGRKKELKTLNELRQRGSASLVAIKGKRRIGKSRLIEESARGLSFYKFIGLPPEKNITAQDQRDHFAYLLSQQTPLPKITSSDWSELFQLLASQVHSDMTVVLLDEITWMAQGDPTFLGKLKNAWELFLKQNPKLILVLCGSISAWIEKNILSSTGYFGRITKRITLKELPIDESNQLLTEMGFKGSIYERFLALSLTGGIPWYIELFDKHYSASENIKQLCFEPNGILVTEHKYIFHDLFGNRSETYEAIARFLSNGLATYNEISAGIKFSSGGTLSAYLDELIECGYISREFSWSLLTGKESKIHSYRLADNYLRFYYKYIEPNMNKILKGQFNNQAITSLPGWNSMMGLQFEHLILTNRRLILEALNISLEDIVSDNPFYQTKTKQHLGCQIDYLIQTRLNTLYVCEIKFSKNPITKSIIEEMKAKIQKLVTPKNFMCVPVLIHINGVTDNLADSSYFYKIIDFSEFINIDITQ